MGNNEIEFALNERFLLQKEYLGENKVVNQIQPIVSVTVATYQHVNYIRKCLDGILMQKTTFPYEIILGEDGSIDGTQDICKEYAERFPDKIRLFIRDRKLSQYIGKDGKVTRFNGIWNRMSSRGKYIAWCEGDDYWIDSLKLQKQVDFLECHYDYSMCFHNAIQKWESDNKEDVFAKITNRTYSGIEIFNKWIVPTASSMFRKEVIFTNIYRKAIVNSEFLFGDNILFLCAAEMGNIWGMEECMCVYRRHKDGMVFSFSEERLLKMNVNDKAVWNLFGNNYKKVATNRICKRNIYLFLRTNRLRRKSYFPLLVESFRLNLLLSFLYFFYSLFLIILRK